MVTSYYIRMFELANFFVREGYEVDIYCLSRTTWRADEDGIIIDERINVYPVFSVLTYFDVVGCMVDSFISKLSCIMTKAIKRLYLRFASHVVDYEQLANRKFVSKVRSGIKQGEVVNIITSSPSHSIHSVGQVLKRSLGDDMNWIADFRDPWVARPLYNIDPVNGAFERDLEKAFSQEADHVTVVSEGMADYYQEVRGGHVEVVENGYIEVEPRAPSTRLQAFVEKQHAEGRVVLGYFGTGGIGAGGESGKDLGFLGEMLNNHPQLADRFALVMQGAVVVNENNWGDRLLVLESTTLPSVRANICLVDVGLNVYTCVEDADMTVGSKVYEIIASGRPAWCLIPNGARSIRQFATKVGGVTITDPNNRDEVVAHANRILEILEGNPAAEIDQDALREYRRDSQNRKMLDLLR